MFRYVIIMTIISNCVVMSMDEHLPHGDKTVLAKKLVITPTLLPIAIVVVIIIITTIVIIDSIVIIVTIIMVIKVGLPVYLAIMKFLPSHISSFSRSAPRIFLPRSFHHHYCKFDLFITIL